MKREMPGRVFALTISLFTSSTSRPHDSHMPSEHPDPELAGYRPVNSWAVAALLLGFAAPLAFADPLLWWVPLVGIAIAIVASGANSPVGYADGRTQGRDLRADIVGDDRDRRAGSVSDAQLLARRAVGGVGEQWFDRLRDGQTQAAFDLMFHVPPRHVPPPHENAHDGSHDGHTASAAPPEKTELDTFLARPAGSQAIGRSATACNAIACKPASCPRSWGGKR